VLKLAAEVVSAHLANNTVPVDELPKLIQDVHRALANAGQAAIPSPRGEPAVPIRKSIFPGYLVCLECGKHFSMLKRHLASDHQLTPQQDRQKWELPSSYPIVSPDYTKVRSTLAKKLGLGRKEVSMKAGRKKQARQS
jgi:predicted transcriptional regulator